MNRTCMRLISFFESSSNYERNGPEIAKIQQTALLIESFLSLKIANTQENPLFPT